MKKMIAIIFVLLTCASITTAFARGGQAADDCPPGSKDPDCADGGSKPAGK